MIKFMFKLGLLVHFPCNTLEKYIYLFVYLLSLFFICINANITPGSDNTFSLNTIYLFTLAYLLAFLLTPSSLALYPFKLGPWLPS